MPLTKVNPAGNVSVTVSVPLVAPVPPFITFKAYCATLWPCVKLEPKCPLLMVRSESWMTVTVSVLLLAAVPRVV